MFQRLFPALVLASASLALTPAVAPAQVHAVGEAWILRDAPVSTEVHLQGDALCTVDFAAQCYGGMMAPDSVLCVLDPLPTGDWPEQCLQAVTCTVTDPDGHPMFDGGGMQGGMMRSDVVVQLHYPTSGVDPSSLCLVRLDGSAPVVCDGAVQDAVAGTFTLATSAPSATFAVVPRTTIVPAAAQSLSAVKTRY